MALALIWPPEAEVAPMEALRAWRGRPEGFLWLDLCGPGEAEKALLRETFGFHPLALEDAYAAHYFLVFYAAALDEGTGLQLRPLHLFVGPRAVVTVRPEAIPEVEADHPAPARRSSPSPLSS